MVAQMMVHLENLSKYDACYTSQNNGDVTACLLTPNVWSYINFPSLSAYLAKSFEENIFFFI